MKKDQPVECVGCNTFDVGTVIDNSNCTAVVEKNYATEQEAQRALEQLTQKAKDIASEPCEIDSSISQSENKFTLKASFTFCCQAETLIFELGLR
ncbi:YfcZ/YiiS family protein [Seminibacterium arietis]|uniref:YfcZ/YiiS family protein n=1 Tax=Seminibacterium arietis TaxID=1173502 RepID=A0ABW3IAY8_9PAST